MWEVMGKWDINIRYLLRLNQVILNPGNLKFSSCILTMVAVEFPVSFLAPITGNLLGVTCFASNQVFLFYFLDKYVLIFTL